MKENTKKNELLNKWFEFRSEEFETNISAEDRKYMFSFQDILDEFLKTLPEDKQEWAIKFIDEYDDKYCKCYIYWTKIFRRKKAITIKNNTV